MPSVQILLAPINVSALQDIPVMVFHVQVRKPRIFYIFSLARRKRVHELHLDSLALEMSCSLSDELQSLLLASIYRIGTKIWNEMPVTLRNRSNNAFRLRGKLNFFSSFVPLYSAPVQGNGPDMASEGKTYHVAKIISNVIIVACDHLLS